LTSEADKAVGLLGRFVQLTQSGKLPSRSEIGGRLPVASGLLLIQHTAAQAGCDTDNAIEAVSLDELAPLPGDIEFILRGHDIARRAVDAILVQEQPDDLMPTGKHRFGKAQGAPRSGRVGWGIKGDYEFHGAP